MSLAAPLFLLLLLLLPAGWLALRAARDRRRRHAIRMPAVATLRAIGAVQPWHRRWLPTVLLAAAVALLAVAIARPERTVKVPVERATVMLVTDASGSMDAQDVQPTRIDAARNAALSFLDEVPAQTRVGLIGYSSTPSTVQEPTTDRAAVRNALAGLQADGGTATGDALAVALDALQAEGDPQGGGDKPPGAVLLLSDGASMTGEDPLEVARRARQQNIPVYTVALGTDQGYVTGGRYGASILRVPPDPETMREIARVSGGESFSVDDANELDKIYEQVGARVATESEQREITVWFAGGALLLLLVGVGLGVRWRSRVA
ncbi:VWA domain-containing protein [Patulibacter sp. S7RM1-6]